MNEKIKTLLDSTSKRFDEKWYVTGDGAHDQDFWYYQALNNDDPAPAIKSFNLQSQLELLAAVREVVSALEVGKPNSEAEEVPYEIKKIIVEEAKQVLLTALSEGNKNNL